MTTYSLFVVVAAAENKTWVRMTGRRLWESRKLLMMIDCNEMAGIGASEETQQGFGKAVQEEQH